jgi:hypothetical protein
LLERAMGIEFHPKFLSLTEPRRYQALRESIVAKCCQIGVSAVGVSNTC